MAIETTQPPRTTAPAQDTRLGWALGLLAVVVLLQLVALLMMNSRMNDLQRGIDGATLAADSAGGVPSPDTSATDACRILGALAAKSGIDLPTVFRDEPVSGECELAAEAAAHAVRSSG
jgi:hypothetical protein